LAAIEEAQIVALADVSKKALAAFRQQVPGTAKVPAFTDYREMLNTVELDAVEISTPHTLHYQQIMDSLDQGLHVLTEKPMVCTVEHAKQVIAKRDATGKHLMISYQRHFSPPYIYAYELLHSGDLGPVNFLCAHQCQNWYRNQQGKWRLTQELGGGGQLNDSGSHLLDILLWMTDLRPVEVMALMDYKDTPVDIFSAISVKFDNGALGNISVVGHAIGRMHEDASIWCEEGTLFIREGRVFQEVPGQRMEPVPEEKMPAGSNPDRAFIDLLLGKAENRVPAECGLRVIQLTEAAWESARRGRAVQVEE